LNLTFVLFNFNSSVVRAAVENHKVIEELKEGYELVCITASASGGMGLSVSMLVVC